MRRNHTMLQFFEWHIPNHGKHWEDLAILAHEFSIHGIDTVWIPPACKGMTQADNGYGIYDHYDLGEFDQKGTVRTKYGTREELLKAIAVCRKENVQVLADVVLNHKAGADDTERFEVVEVDPDNRLDEISEPFEIEGWTSFTFPGRKGNYSSFTWTHHQFNGTDYDAAQNRSGIYRILGENKAWNEQVDEEFGNYDYLMFANIDYRNPEVQDEMINWGKWFIKTTGCHGFRLDAIKHINYSYVSRFAHSMKEAYEDDFYFVGEFWNPDIEAKKQFLDQTDFAIHLFDVGLHYRFHQASLEGRDFDLRTLYDGTLVATHPTHAVTFVDNHDSQPGESLESWVEDWFKPIAYAFILLRADGFPCVFFGDYLGIRGDDPIPAKKELLDPLLDARYHLAYGEQTDYFDHANTVGWIRHGVDDLTGSGCAVVISTGDEGFKDMQVDQTLTGSVWIDVTGNRTDEVEVSEDAIGRFTVNGGSVSVWAQKKYGLRRIEAVEERS
ncbi:alpha-amylase [Salisediminibacterium beveridgei]|uniref:Glucan 1,4-alpha-maltohexaosidase n=1 Tax=Salisediminibacterium beveridgei TaxID=632773 RepID=A0A1D7QR25_9BACI|nr:alpha-amylase [Salisediminibacterium beveridgei]AOM81469.1 Glucan 1,4-alpha-maltohexaosidase [Salisediminibacterium beveridgei]